MINSMENASNPVFPGADVGPEDSRYPTLVRGFNQRWVGQPEFVKVLGPEEDLAALLEDYVSRGLRITVRGGGHCYEDFASGNVDGVIIDLSSLNRVYKLDGYFVIEGGCTLWNVYNQLYHQYNVTMPGGSCYSVGAGGHICGGGYGLLSRLHGLSIDWLSGVEVVVVDGEGKGKKVQAFKDSEDPALQDLFWAHTGGGGGNFGIVTKYFFKELPEAPGEAFLATVAWDWKSTHYTDDDADEEEETKEDGETVEEGEENEGEVQEEEMVERTMPFSQFQELLVNYSGFFMAHSQPDNPYAGLFALLHLNYISSGQITMTVQYVKQDPAETDTVAMAKLQAFLDTVNPSECRLVAATTPSGYHGYLHGSTEIRKMPWLEATQTLNGSGPNRRGKYKSAYHNKVFSIRQMAAMYVYLTGLSEEQITVPHTQALIQIDSYGCQINALPGTATAIPQRSSIVKLQYQIYWDKPGPEGQWDEENVAWMRALYGKAYGPDGPKPDLDLPPTEREVDGCYVNYPDVDLVNWQLLYYEENYPRLQAVKAEWDPLNVFHHAQSIELPGNHKNEEEE